MTDTEEILQRSIECDFEKIKSKLSNIVDNYSNQSKDYAIKLSDLEELQKIFDVFEDKVIHIFETRDLIELATNGKRLV